MPCCTPLPIIIAPSLARIEFSAVAGHKDKLLHSPVGETDGENGAEIRISANYKEERLTGVRV
jgi:hypothetical protein